MRGVVSAALAAAGSRGMRGARGGAVVGAAFAAAWTLSVAPASAAGRDAPPVDFGEYRALVAEVQEFADRSGSGRIVVVDRSINFREAHRRASEVANIPSPQWSTIASARQGLAWRAAAVDGAGSVCLVVGAPMDSTPMSVFGGSPLLRGFDAGEATSTDVHRLVLYHELAHCMNGASEEVADAFSALVAVRLGRAQAILPLLAAWREAAEWTARPGQPYLSARVVTGIVREAADLAKDPDVASGDPRRLLAAAVRVNEAFPVRSDVRGAIEAVRTALADLGGERLGSVRFTVPVAEGVVSTNLRGWIDSSAGIPEVGRLSAALGRLEDASLRVSAPTVYRTDACRSHAAERSPRGMEDAAWRTVSSRLASALALYSGSVREEPVALAPAKEVPGALMAFDRAAMVWDPAAGRAEARAR